MTDATKLAIETLAKDSYAGKLSFGQVVGSLVDAGVASYFVDYRTGVTTYYFEEGGVCTLDFGKKEYLIPAVFDAQSLVAAIRGAQRDEVRYPEFVRLSMTAGCVGYFVWITGRHVSYFGHAGEVHVEQFPSAK